MITRPSITAKRTSSEFHHAILTQDSAVWKPFDQSQTMDFPMFFTYGTRDDPTAEPCKQVLAQAYHKWMLVVACRMGRLFWALVKPSNITPEVLVLDLTSNHMQLTKWFTGELTQCVPHSGGHRLPTRLGLVLTTNMCRVSCSPYQLLVCVWPV